MNILEHYIVEIHSVVAYEEDWTEKFGKEFVQIDVTTNCHGHSERRSRIITEEELNEAKEKGYFMW